MTEDPSSFKMAGERAARDADEEKCAGSLPKAPSHTAPSSGSWLKGGGGMGDVVRSFDWAKTALGPLEQWPQSLRTMVSLCLGSSHPSSLIWGPGQVQIYNDGYRQICGGMHVNALGCNFKECWIAAWPIVGGSFLKAFAGTGSDPELQRVFLRRHGFLEEAFFSYSFCPVRGETGEVAGVFHPVTELTSQLLAERRARALRDVMVSGTRARSPRQAIELTVAALAEHTLDVPFAVVYMLGGLDEEGRALEAVQLASHGPVPQALFRAHIALGSGAPLAGLLQDVRTSNQIVVVEDLAARFGPIPAGEPYPEAPRHAVALPILPRHSASIPGGAHASAPDFAATSASATFPECPQPNPVGASPRTDAESHDHGRAPVAVLIVGTSARLPLNDAYCAFLEVMSNLVANSAGDLHAHADEVSHSALVRHHHQLHQDTHASVVTHAPNGHAAREHQTWISREVKVFEELLNSVTTEQGLWKGSRDHPPVSYDSTTGTARDEILKKDAMARQRTAELEGRVRQRTAALALVARRLDQEILERKLSQQRALWLATFPECDPDPVVEIEIVGAGSIIYANPAARRMPGLEEEGVDHPLIAGLIKLAAQTWLKGLPGPTDREVEFGDYCYAQRLFFVPETRHLRAYSRDIATRKAAESALRASEARYRELNALLEQRVEFRTRALEEANRELEAFTFTVSHDLRTPLRAIDGYVKALMEDYEELLPAEGKRFMKIVHRGAQRMGLLIDDLLRFSRLSRQELLFKNVDMLRMVQDVLEEMEPMRKGRNLEVKIHDLPPCKGDRTLLRQVWANLISNALKYTRKRAHAVVEIGCCYHPDQYQHHAEAGTSNLDQSAARNAAGSSISPEHKIYYVQDNGTGFDMRYVGKLFGVFQRLHSADDYEGNGVGLAISRRVIQRHGGYIWVTAEPDKGSTFWFTVPPGKNVLEEGDKGAEE